MTPRHAPLTARAFAAWAAVALTATLSCGTPPCEEGEPCATEPDAAAQGASDAAADGPGASPDGAPLDASRDGATGDAGGLLPDGAPVDAGAADGAPNDAGASADGALDGSSASDAGSDSGDDAGGADAGGDSGADAGADAASDAGSGGPGGCVSGASGTHAARFKWIGSGPSSTASVSYELNNLPDTSRWRAGAYSRSGVGYVPRFTDTFLGVGGLEMGGTVFIDVELSTAMLSSLRRVTLSVFGRSFNTTAPGSFSWMTFDGAGAAPSGLVSNAAPYRWYSVDATSAFRPGNAGVLLRVSPGGPSGTLIVSRVELCFDASR